MKIYCNTKKNRKPKNSIQNYIGKNLWIEVNKTEELNHAPITINCFIKPLSMEGSKLRYFIYNIWHDEFGGTDYEEEIQDIDTIELADNPLIFNDDEIWEAVKSIRETA